MSSKIDSDSLFTYIPKVVPNSKYLSEVLVNDRKFIDLITGDKTVLVEAPMGSGKSKVMKYAIPNLFPKDEKMIFINISPLKILTDQFVEDGGFMRLFEFLISEASGQHLKIAQSIQTIENKFDHLAEVLEKYRKKVD